MPLDAQVTQEEHAKTKHTKKGLEPPKLEVSGCSGSHRVTVQHRFYNTDSTLLSKPTEHPSNVWSNHSIFLWKKEPIRRKVSITIGDTFKIAST